MAGNATATIKIKGRDEASGAIRKAQDSVGGLAGSLASAQQRSSGLSNSLGSLARGDLQGGLGGVSQALGGASGIAGSAALAAAGVAGVVAGIGAAAVKITEMSIEVERLRAQMRFAFEGGEEEALALADAIGGVAVESVVKLQTTLKASGVDASLTVEQLQAITNAATVMGKTGDDALIAFADAIRTGTGRALKGVGVFVSSEKAIKDYADSLGLATNQLTDADKSQAILNATIAALPGVAQAGTDAYGRQDRALATLSNATTAFKLELSALAAGPAVEVVEALNEITSEIGGLEKVARTTAKLIFAPFRALYFGVQEGSRALDLALKRDFAGAAEAAASALIKLNPVTGALAQAVDDVSDAASNNAAGAKKQVDGMKSVGVTSSGLAASLLQLGQAERSVAEWTRTAGDAAAKAAAKRQQAAAKAAAERKRVQDLIKRQDAEFSAGLSAQLQADAARAREIRAAELDAVQAVADKLGALRDARMQAELAGAGEGEQRRIELLQIEQDRVAGLVAITNDLALTRQQAAQATADIEATAAARRSVIHQQEMAQIAAEQAARIDMSLSTASAAVSGLQEIEGAERVAAAGKAILAAAEGALAFTRGRYDQAAAGAFAALQFGRVALGGGAPAAPAAVAAPAAAPAQAAAPAASAGGGSSVVVNINSGLGTAAEVGAAVRRALAAVSGTGFGAVPA